MRFGNFESAGQKPLGEGKTKEVFVNPDDETKIISVVKEEDGEPLTELKEYQGRMVSVMPEAKEKDTPRQLKGRFYLTKIAHTLLPDNIPDIYQVMESADGQQTIDSQRISHTPEQANLQKTIQTGEAVESAEGKVFADLSEEINQLEEDFVRIGIHFDDNADAGNYTKNEAGNAYYLHTFQPWETSLSNPKEIELTFDEKELRDAIENLPDNTDKNKTLAKLDRLLVLFDEEKQELQKSQAESLNEQDPRVHAFESQLSIYTTEEYLELLKSIQTEEEAYSSQERKDAVGAMKTIYKNMDPLLTDGLITEEKYSELYKKVSILTKAIGKINRGLVDHSR